MKFSYSALIIILFTQLSQADEKLAQELCSKIKKDQDQNNLCLDIGAQFPNSRRIMQQNCEFVLHNLRENSFEADKICAETFEPLAPMTENTERNYIMAPTVAAAGLRGPALVQDTPPTISNGMNKCQPKPPESYSCAGGDPFSFLNLEALLSVPEKMPDYAVTVENAKFGDDECNCFKKQSESIIKEKGVVLFEAQIKKEENEINEIVFQAAAVRILNSFASNLEDISFYRSNRTALIGGDETARKLQCNDVSQYRAKVTAACGGKVSQKIIDQRMSDIMSSLGDAKDEKTLEAKFAKIESKVLDVLVTKDVGGQKKALSRMDYDRIRFGAAQGLPEVKLINQLTDMLMNHPVLGKELEHAMDVERHNPGRAIFSMLRREDRPEVKELLLKIARDPLNKGELSRSIIAVVQTPNTEDLGTLIDERLQKTMDMHPSLRAIFRNRELFEKVREASHEAAFEAVHQSGAHYSILAQMDANPSFMKDYFEERCGKIQDQFAEAVCVQDNNFVAQTSPEDLNMLLSNPDKDINPNLKDLIICRIPKDQSPNSVFKKLAFKKWDKLSQSDYWRAKNGGASEDSFLSSVTNIVQSGDKEAFKFLGNLSQMGDSSRKPDADFVASVSKKDSFSFIANPTPKIEAPVEKDREFTLAKGLVNLSEGLGGTDAAVAGNAIIPGIAEYTAPGPVPGVDNNVISRERRDRSKSELRDFLSDEDSAVEVDKHLSQIKTEDQLELIRLKDELSKNKEMLLNLTSQNEQNKLKALQERYQALENSKTVQPVVANDDSQTEAVRSNTRINSGTGNASSNALTPGDVLRENSIASNAQTSGAESGAGSSASRSPSAIGNARVNSAGSDSSFAFSSSSKGEILIEQAGSTFANGQQLAPEDLGLVIQRYVEQTELDVQTLKQLKDQEVVIKYKVVENGVEVLKTMKVKSTALTPETKKFLADQIAIKEKEVERLEARRAHSFATLKLLLGIKTKTMY